MAKEEDYLSNVLPELKKAGTRQIGDLTYTTPFPSYVGLPVETLGKATDELADKYKANRTKYAELNTALAKDLVLDQDSAIKQKAMDKLKQVGDQFTTEGNWEYGFTPITKAAEDYLGNQGLMKAKANYLKREENIKALQSLVGKEGFTQERINQAIAKSDAQYQPVQYIDPKTGQVIDETTPGGIYTGEYKGWTPAAYADINKLAEMYGSQQVANYVAEKGYTIGGNGRIYTDASETKEITYDEIIRDLTKVMKTDVPINDWLNSQFEMDNFGKTIWKSRDGASYDLTNPNQRQKAIEKFKDEEMTLAMQGAAGRHEMKSIATEKGLQFDQLWMHQQEWDLKKKLAKQKGANKVVSLNASFQKGQMEQITPQTYEDVKNVRRSLEQQQLEAKQKYEQALEGYKNGTNTDTEVANYKNQLQIINTQLRYAQNSETGIDQDVKRVTGDYTKELNDIIYSDDTLVSAFNKMLSDATGTTIKSKEGLNLLARSKGIPGNIIYNQFIKALREKAENPNAITGKTFVGATGAAAPLVSSYNRIKSLFDDRMTQYFESKQAKNIETNLVTTGTVSGTKQNYINNKENSWNKFLQNPTNFKLFNGETLDNFLVRKEGGFINASNLKGTPDLSKSKVLLQYKPIDGKLYLQVALHDKNGQALRFGDNKKQAVVNVAPEQQIQYRDDIYNLGLNEAAYGESLIKQQEGLKAAAYTDFADLFQVQPQQMKKGDKEIIQNPNFLSKASTSLIIKKVDDFKFAVYTTRLDEDTNTEVEDTPYKPDAQGNPKLFSNMEELAMYMEKDVVDEKKKNNEIPNITGDDDNQDTSQGYFDNSGNAINDQTETAQ